jgi:hypothetical protein
VKFPIQSTRQMPVESEFFRCTEDGACKHETEVPSSAPFHLLLGTELAFHLREGICEIHAGFLYKLSRFRLQDGISLSC